VTEHNQLIVTSYCDRVDCERPTVIVTSLTMTELRVTELTLTGADYDLDNCVGDDCDTFYLFRVDSD
jgi:hypothetical protein